MTETTHTRSRRASLGGLILQLVAFGGILALALVRPGEGGQPRYSAADIVALYENHGHRIFHRSFWHKLAALGNVNLSHLLDRQAGEVIPLDSRPP